MGTTTPLPMADEKKSVFKLFKTKKATFLNLFKGNNNKKEIERESDQRDVIEKLEQIQKAAPQVDTLIANFRKLELEKSRKKEERFDEEEDELKNFTYRIINDDHADRNSSQSSDSGFFDKQNHYKEDECIDDVIERKIITKETECETKNEEEASEKFLFTRSKIQDDTDETTTVIKINETRVDSDEDKNCTNSKNTSVKNDKQICEDAKTKINKQNDDADETSEDTDDVTKCMESLNLADGKKQKRVQTVVLARGPIRHKVGDVAGSSIHPYQHEYGTDSYRQINQINKQTLSGGQVIVNDQALENEILESLNAALENVQRTSDDWNNQGLLKNDTTVIDEWDIVQEFINEESVKSPENSQHDEIHYDQETLLKEFGIQPNYENNLTVNVPDIRITEESFIHKFNDNNMGFLFDHIDVSDMPLEEEIANNERYTNIYPTPPRSDNMSSPVSDKSYGTNNLDYVSSPSISSPNSEYEKYQEIQQIDDYPTTLDPVDKKDSNPNRTIDRNARERISSGSTMTMKQFKDMQKEIVSGLSNMECCKTNRKSCKEFFQERFNKIPIEERKRLLMKVASLDFNTAYGVLNHVLRALSSPKVESEDIQYCLFALIAEQILAKGPALFLDEHGLNLLKSAVLRCWSRPELTRYLVRCIRTALKLDVQRSKEECIFKELDGRGDNLVLSCVRAGDQCAPTLAEITRGTGPDGGQLPLFNVAHHDDEGLSAIHLACKEHSSTTPRLHTVHVLLEHAGMDLWRGDVKGGDTALHLAVNSAWCDLRLVLLLFSRLERGQWKRLAHAPNRSSCTPLEYARSAAKTATRQHYPHEVLDFLKKCR